MESIPQEGKEVIRRVLSEDEQKAWLGLVNVYEALARALEQTLLAEHRLALSTVDTLMAVGHAPGGEISISELAARVRLSPSRTSRLVMELEQEGLVERRRTSEDLRSTRAAITAHGMERLREVAPAYLTTLRRLLFEGLSERDVKQLARILERVSTRVAQSPSRR